MYEAKISKKKNTRWRYVEKYNENFHKETCLLLCVHKYIKSRGTVLLQFSLMFKIHKYVFRIRYRFHIEAYCIKIYICVDFQTYRTYIHIIQSRRHHGMKVVEPEKLYESMGEAYNIFNFFFSNIPTDEYLMVELGNVWEVV